MTTFCLSAHFEETGPFLAQGLLNLCAYWMGNNENLVTNVL